jgi:hypothetical protein
VQAFSAIDRPNIRRTLVRLIEQIALSNSGRLEHALFLQMFNAELELLGAASVLQAPADLAMHVFQQPAQRADAGLLP